MNPKVREDQVGQFSTGGVGHFYPGANTNGRKFRSMNIIDDFRRECLAIEVSYSFASVTVFRLLELIADERGLPETIR